MSLTPKRRVVLVGGGHAHVQVMTELASKLGTKDNVSLVRPQLLTLSVSPSKSCLLSILSSASDLTI